MEIRLNKLLSEAGVCSRREADQFIETERVTVNGKFPRVGQRVTATDEVLVDGEKINIEKYLQLQEEQRQQEAEEREQVRSLLPFKATGRAAKEAPKKTGEKYGKFNKYAAARKAAKEGRTWEDRKEKQKKATYEEQLLREALRPQFGKSLSRSAVAQRIVANPKSAALRKTSRNNPINKAKRAAKYRSRGNE